MKIRSELSSGLNWLQRTRLKWLLVMVLLCLVFRENYPFSNFPMYSSFADQDYYIYLSDRRGRALATPHFGLASSTLKKIFNRYRRTELKNFRNAGSARAGLAEQAAAESLLHYLDGLAATHPKAKKLLSGAQLETVRVHQESGALLFDKRTLAMHE